MRREGKAVSNLGLALRSGRNLRCARTTASSQDRKCREISNPEADLQLISPPANRELFKSRFAKARKMNARLSCRAGFSNFDFRKTVMPARAT